VPVCSRSGCGGLLDKKTRLGYHTDTWWSKVALLSDSVELPLFASPIYAFA